MTKKLLIRITPILIPVCAICFGLLFFLGPSNSSSINIPYFQSGSFSSNNKTLPEIYQNSDFKPTLSMLKEGQSLFNLNCSSCHGLGAGGSAVAPNLVGLGPATIDFWVSTGRMPLADPVVQPARKPVRFTRNQILDIVAYVTSLGPGGPLIPDISGYKKASLSEGASLFALNCAGCHTITGAGDALAYGAQAPSLHSATPEQVAEAIRTGPASMPRFNSANISQSQLDSLVRYVTQSIQKPANIGGYGLGGIGPVAEGFIGLLIGLGLIMLFAFWIGDRA